MKEGEKRKRDSMTGMFMIGDATLNISPLKESHYLHQVPLKVGCLFFKKAFQKEKHQLGSCPDERQPG